MEFIYLYFKKIHILQMWQFVGRRRGPWGEGAMISVLRVMLIMRSGEDMVPFDPLHRSSSSSSSFFKPIFHQQKTSQSATVVIHPPHDLPCFFFLGLTIHLPCFPSTPAITLNFKLMINNNKLSSFNACVHIFLAREKGVDYTFDG